MKKRSVIFIFLILFGLLFLSYLFFKKIDSHKEYYGGISLDVCLDKGGDMLNEYTCPDNFEKIGDVYGFWCRCICCKPKKNFIEKVSYFLESKKQEVNKNEKRDQFVESKKNKEQEKTEEVEVLQNMDKVSYENLEDFRFKKAKDNWKEYNNEEYNFSLLYPNDWSLEDYSNKFNYLKLGFYPPNKEKGWEYLGDINVRVLEEKEIRSPFPEKYNVKALKDSNVVFVGYDIPGNIDKDMAYVKCNSYYVVISSVTKTSLEVFHSMIGEMKCLD